MDWIAAGVIAALVVVINREIVRFARQRILCQHEWVGAVEEDDFDGSLYERSVCARCKLEAGA